MVSGSPPGPGPALVDSSGADPGSMQPPASMPAASKARVEKPRRSRRMGDPSRKRHARRGTRVSAPLARAGWGRALRWRSLHTHGAGPTAPPWWLAWIDQLEVGAGGVAVADVAVPAPDDEADGTAVVGLDGVAAVV